MLDWHGQPVRISDSREQLANFQGNREREERNSSNLQLNPFVFSLYSSHLDYQMQIIYDILLANPYSALVCEIPSKIPVFQPRGCTPLDISLKGECSSKIWVGIITFTLPQDTSSTAQSSFLFGTTTQSSWTIVCSSCCDHPVDATRMQKNTAGTETVAFKILGEDQMKEKIKLKKQHLIM